MTPAFVRLLGTANNKTAGTTLATTTTATSGAGNLIVACVLFDNFTTASQPTISSISKPGTETASWVSLGAARSTSTSGGAFASGEMWCIQTTVSWASATSITVTLNNSVTQKAAQFIEFSNTTSSVRSTTGTAYSTTTTAASAATTGTAPASGDLVLGFVFQSNSVTAASNDTDTLNGSWSAMSSISFGSTGGSAATNNWGNVTYKVTTASGHQTLNSSAALTAGNGAIIAALQALPDPTISQASYRFYADGTETGATALAAQDTAITADLSANDANVLLRTRLQITNSTPTDPSDNWRLQYELNSSGFWSDVLPQFASLDGYGNALGPTNQPFTTITAYGESFMGNNQSLDRASFYIWKTGTPPGGTLQAKVYAHTGTFGTNGVPTGSPLATSSTTMLDTSLPTTAGFVNFDFAPGSLTPTSGVAYVVTIETTVAGSTGNSVLTASNTTAGSSGNASSFNGSTWSSFGADLLFRVYTVYGTTAVAYDSANLTDQAATTNQLGSGTGSFVAGKISEFGMSTSVGWSGGDYTELLYTLTLLKAGLSASDTLRFRVERNGATTGMTYTVTPTITVSKVTTTPVSTSCVTTWKTLATVTPTRSTTWNTLAAIASAATRSTTWNTLVPVASTATRSTTWKTLAQVAPTRSTTWNTFAQVFPTRTTTWNTLAAIASAATRSTTWNTLVAIASAATRSTTWNTLSSVAPTRTTTWKTLATVTPTRSSTWNTLFSVAPTRSTTWKTLAQITPTRSTTWNTLAQIAPTRSTTWKTLASITATRSTTWNALAAIASAATRSTTWNTLETKTATRTTTWNVASTGATANHWSDTTFTNINSGGSYTNVKFSGTESWTAATPSGITNSTGNQITAFRNDTTAITNDQYVMITVSDLTQEYWLNVRSDGGVSNVRSSGYTFWSDGFGYHWILNGSFAASGSVPPGTGPGTIELRCVSDVCTVYVNGVSYQTHSFASTPMTSGDRYQAFGIALAGAITAAEGGDYVAPTPVSTSVSTTWKTLATITGTRSTTWNTSATLTANRSTTWNTLASRTATRSTTWNTLAALASAATRSTTWNTNAALSANRSTTWRTLFSVTGTRSTTWNALAALSATRSTTWNTLVALATPATRSTTWNVLVGVSKAASTTWNTAASITGTRSTTWVTRASITGTRTTTWNALATIAPASRSTTWVTRFSVTGTRTTTWNTTSTITGTRSTTWAVLTGVSASRSTTWVAAQTITATRTTTWNVAGNLTFVLATRTTTWNTAATISATRSTLWTTLTSVPTAARSTTWVTLARVTPTRTTTWVTRASITGTRTTTWATLSAVTPATRTTSWSVRALITGSRITTWVVREAKTFPVVTTWNTRAALSASRVTVWNTYRALPPASFTTSWNVATAMAHIVAFRTTTWYTRADVRHYLTLYPDSVMYLNGSRILAMYKGSTKFWP